MRWTSVRAASAQSHPYDALPARHVDEPAARTRYHGVSPNSPNSQPTPGGYPNRCILKCPALSSGTVLASEFNRIVKLKVLVQCRHLGPEVWPLTDLGQRETNHNSTPERRVVRFIYNGQGTHGWSRVSAAGGAGGANSQNAVRLVTGNHLARGSESADGQVMAAAHEWPRLATLAVKHGCHRWRQKQPTHSRDELRRMCPWQEAQGRAMQTQDVLREGRRQRHANTKGASQHP